MNEAIQQQVNRLVTPDEIQQALHGDISSDERDEVQRLIRWFTVRYPTAEERLAYVRQAYARWLTNISTRQTS
jgi:hypothetical protein